jgi:predicted nucleotidyltransferase
MDTSFVDDLGTTLLGKTRGAVLGLLLGRPDEEFHVRQIARLSGATLGPVQRELRLLARLGVLKCRAVGHQLLYGADPISPLHEELRSLVLKTVGMAGAIKAALNPLAPHIQAAFLFGSFAQGRQRRSSDVDVMVIGDISVAAIAKALAEPQRRLGREINPAVYHQAEFASKVRDGHHFLTSVMQGSKVFLVGDEHELSRLAKERLASAAQDQPPGDRRPARRHRARLGRQRRLEDRR